MALIDGQPSVLLENVINLIRKKVKGDQTSLIEKFATIFYGNMSKEDLANRNDSDLYGAALSLWNGLNQDSTKPTIKVYNPELSKHGWESQHTIVELIIEDMPFLVDSVRMSLNRLGITAHLLMHCPLKLFTDKSGKITDLATGSAAQGFDKNKTVFLIEVDRQTNTKTLKAITEELQSVVVDVSVSVSDWQAISDRLKEVITEIPKSAGKNSKAKIKEVQDFLKWVADHNFTLMGYRQYTVKPVKGDHELSGVKGTSLGLMKNSVSNKVRKFSELPTSARKEALSDNLLILTKTNSKSRVHRPAYIDYIGIKRFDDEGNVIGEDRFIGLFSASFYNNRASDIPLINNKLNRIMDSFDYEKDSHAYKALLNILETYPRDELIQASEAELKDVAQGVLQMQERDMSRLFVRKDIFGRFFSCMVYVPRERYNTQLRRDTQALFKKAFGSDEYVEFTTYFSESVLARTHYIVRVQDNNKEIDVKDIENNLREAARTWDDKLHSALLESFGEATGKELARKYSNAFQRSYKEDNLPSASLVDIDKLELLNDDNKLEMLFYQPQEEKLSNNLVRLKLYHKDEPIHLSDVLPMLENFGLRVIGETPSEVHTLDGSVNWILDFSMMINSGAEFDLEKAQIRFQNAFAKVWRNNLEDDGFNRLVLGSDLTGREASILRAYAKYFRQIGGTFSQSYIESTFANYPHIAGLIVEVFKRKFSPKTKASPKTIEKLLKQINEELDNVANLDDDRIIRRFVDMVNATLRTNYYQKNAEGNFKSYISFKLQPKLIPEVPKPLPEYEIFVYSPSVEGVHLRGGKVARGGLRWSDRMEDFRTEILGLVKAQQVKNTVIVPVGAKGGFVCKQLPTTGGREAFFEEGKACYRTFIRGLLDITDNIVHGKVVYPQDVVRLDGDDPYLVVAADKGTATFSDIANGIADEYNFWLGDAFASGGSVGYDHKKMGITAKGAWESVKRHFRELGVDCQTTDFTCIGIGDMAGDVFGNGMLLSKHIRLVAAFNHMHIFIDPNPDAATSYKERERLFNLPRSSWEDYNAELISQGGGIFSRAAKSIKLTPEIKKLIGSQKASLTPNELIKALLKAHVDLIWNGGIGTYVKGTKETDTQVGDRANDPLRVNGNELNAKVFGEGGNLGVTQLGRIEFAANGGKMNTDFIDNAGGVDCSDNEVNIKILLNGLVADGDMTRKQRDQLLYDMTDDVGEVVLQDCYRQTHSISITQLKGPEHLKEQIRFVHELEKDGYLDRELEFLPTDEELSERAITGQGFTRPELSVLIAYGKMVMKEWFVVDEITEHPYFQSLLIGAFPQKLQEKYSKQMAQHPLKSEIIATKLANEIINDMGLNFVHRMKEETGATVFEIASCYVMAREIFELRETWEAIEDLDNKIPAIVQTEMLFQLRRTIRRATRWFLRHRNKAMDIVETINFYAPAFKEISSNLDDYLVEQEVSQLQRSEQDLKREGVPKDIARRISQLSSLFSVMDLAQIANLEQRNINLVADIYFKLGATMDLHWFLDQITNQPVANHWQALARSSYREELDWQQRALTSVVLHSTSKTDPKDAQELIDQWVEEHSSLLERWNHMLAEFKTTQSHEFAKFSVALRELMLLSHNCDTSI
ncbi:NAD-glutamate dehydrogenase [Flocculibacter collagenilyticus]|uniref:NAD-glutamate dehydrogenase n=1 Tax=Flocculibacter collagenilyticus TaxID=2744479 RepID=UPI0018F75A4C|nr:NAD-glutamate dehydrogenase [Flocculibacter collagenilyticus]